MNKLFVQNLVLHNQSELVDMLEHFGVHDAKRRIKDFLDEEELFEVIECDEHEIIAIRKKSTGEVFRKGGSFYYIKYDSTETGIWFDREELYGTYIMKHYYKNYIRGGGGLYNLNEIAESKKSYLARKLGQNPNSSVAGNKIHGRKRKISWHGLN